MIKQKIEQKIVNLFLSMDWFSSIVKNKYLSVIENVEYNPHTEGCGLEDRNITDKYEAMEHGFNRALENVSEEINVMD